MNVVRTANGFFSNTNTGTTPLDLTGGNLVVIGWSAFDTTLNNRTASTVTVDGNSATIVSGSKADNTTSNGQAQLAYYVSSLTGTKNIVLTMSGATCSNVDWYVALLFGAKATGQPDIQGSKTVTAGTSCTVTVTTVLESCILFDVMNGNVGPMTPGAGQTSIMNRSGSTGRGSYKAVGAPGSNSMSYTTTGNDDYAMGVLSIAPLFFIKSSTSDIATFPNFNNIVSI